MANRSAIGARIRVRVEGAEGERSIYRMVGSGGSFGASSLRQEIGLGSATEVMEVEIRWPGSDSLQRLGRLEVDRFYRVLEGGERALVIELEAFKLGGADGGGSHQH